MTTRMQRSTLIMAALGALSAGSAAWAADSSTSSDTEMRMMDADHNGKISSAEHAAGAAKMFQMMDTDKDGKVTAAEMDASQKQMMGKGSSDSAHELSSAEKIKVVDADHDGVLTAAEHKSRFARDVHEDGCRPGRKPHSRRTRGRPPEDAQEVVIYSRAARGAPARRVPGSWIQSSATCAMSPLCPTATCLASTCIRVVATVLSPERYRRIFE